MVGPSDRQTELLQQLAYLDDELTAQEAVLTFVPEPLWSARPPTGAPSLLELYGLMVALGERSYPERLEGAAAPTLAESEAELIGVRDWHEVPVAQMVERVKSARRDLVAHLKGLPAAEWAARLEDGSTVEQLAYDICQDDAHVLRRIGERIHEGVGAPRVRPH